jgi:single-stranded-DNA-specific exonuclease
MKEKKWELKPDLPIEIKQAESNLSWLIRQILYNRGFKTIEQMEDFLANKISQADFDPVGDWFFSYNPFLFKNMEGAVDLIIKHIKEAKKIIVYGDYDADGVTASVLLSESLKKLGAKVDIYLPDRVSEGYGLNKSAIDQIQEEGGELIITVDNGIRNCQEVSYAKSLDLELIITDHHVVPEKAEDMPSCLVIDSADPNSGYPFPLLAGVGVAFKLVSALISKSKLSREEKKIILENCLDLIALGTIADLVPLIGENRLLVSKGLERLNKEPRLGIKALMKIISRQDRPLEAWNVGWQIGPRLNAASRIGHANSAFALLTAKDKNLAQGLANELNKRNIERQEITEKIMAQVEANIDANNLPNIIIGLAQEDQVWNEGVVGLVAGKICEKYYRPTLIVSRIVEEAEFNQEKNIMKAVKTSFKGSGRSVEGFNLILAIEKTAKFLDKFGGHPMACGFSIKSEENYQEFFNLIKEEGEKIDPLILIPKLKLETNIFLSEINLELAEEINKLAPFGQGNQEPKLSALGVILENISFVGSDNQHVKLSFSQENSQNVSAIFFNGYNVCKDMLVGQVFDLAFYIDINEFNGHREVQLKIIDIKKTI